MLVALPLVGAGCQSARFGLFRPRPAEPITAQTAAASSETTTTPESEGNDEMLARVEEFLARTDDYHSTGMGGGSDRQSTEQRTDLAEARPVDPVSSSTSEPSVAEVAVANAQVSLEETADTRPQLAIPVIQSVVIRAAEPVPVTATPPEANKTTNEALTLDDGRPITVDQLLGFLATQAEKEPDFDVEWRLRLAEVAFDAPQRTGASGQSLPDDVQRITGAVVATARAIRRLGRDPAAVADEALENAKRLVRLLAGRADPTIPTVALCRKVTTFGVYDELPREALLAGRSLPAIVYTEVGNLTAEEAAKGTHRTILATRLEVYTADGQSVWYREEPEIIDICRRPRSDFFIAQRIVLPPTLAPGDYILKVLVEDKLSGRANEGSLPFVISGPTSVASTRSP